MTASTPTEITVGLRFRRDQHRALDTIADQLESIGQTEHVSLFRQSAEHARSGEPLIVHAASVLEIELMVAGYTQFPGVVRPVVEQLNG
ncbi:MAG: hypothetical protein ACPHCI_06155 [Solirubrobacterales bacterium]